MKKVEDTVIKYTDGLDEKRLEKMRQDANQQSIIRYVTISRFRLKY